MIRINLALPKSWTVYKITGPTGVYVGQTSKPVRERFIEHMTGRCCKKLVHAIGKYGREAFTYETLERCYSLFDACAAERKWIEALDSLSNGYNLTPGGEGGTRKYCKSGLHLLEEVHRYGRSCGECGKINARKRSARAEVKQAQKEYRQRPENLLKEQERSRGRKIEFRERYRTDPEFREHIRAQARAQAKKKRKQLSAKRKAKYHSDPVFREKLKEIGRRSAAKRSAERKRATLL